MCLSLLGRRTCRERGLSENRFFFFLVGTPSLPPQAAPSRPHRSGREMTITKQNRTPCCTDELSSSTHLSCRRHAHTHLQELQGPGGLAVVAEGLDRHRVRAAVVDEAHPEHLLEGRHHVAPSLLSRGRPVASHCSCLDKRDIMSNELEDKSPRRVCM